MQYRIDYLASYPGYIAELAGWHHSHWQHLNPEDYTLAERINEYEQACQTDSIPLMLVAHDGNKPLGSTRLVQSDMQSHPELTPWLASLYVRPDYRNQGIAYALIRRLEQEAQRLGYTQLYLYTEDRMSLYTNAGWQVLSTEEYYAQQVTIMCRQL